MRNLNLDRCALLSCAFVVTLLVACGGSQPPIKPSQVQTNYGQPRDSSGGSGYRVLFSFGKHTSGFGNPRRGAYPAAGLTEFKQTLYGTTSAGGQNLDWGTVFSITTYGRQRLLYTFQCRSDGGAPLDTLVAVKGKLYGTASTCGDQLGDGTVFGIDPTGRHFHVLHQFAGGRDDGSQPLAGLVPVRGWLYGTTYYGGTANKGTVFGLKLSNGKIKILHSFGLSTDGCGPMAPLLYTHGTLYGTTWQCGTGQFGTVFSVDIAASTEKVLHNFSGSDGATPVAGLIMQNGLLYGVTDFGGAYNAGTVFSLTAQGSEHVLHSFGYGNDGAVPKAALIAGPGAVLYGTTYYGGVTGFGTIFSISLSGVENVVHNFRDGYRHDGTYPEASLLYLGQTAYGTTSQGGRSGHPCLSHPYCDYGTIFDLTL